MPRRCARCCVRCRSMRRYSSRTAISAANSPHSTKPMSSSRCRARRWHVVYTMSVRRVRFVTALSVAVVAPTNDCFATETTRSPRRTKIPFPTTDQDAAAVVCCRGRRYGVVFLHPSARPVSAGSRRISANFIQQRIVLCRPKSHGCFADTQAADTTDESIFFSRHFLSTLVALKSP